MLANVLQTHLDDGNHKAGEIAFAEMIDYRIG